MKRLLLLSAIASLAFVGTASQARADYPHAGSYPTYRHDHTGYWDARGHHRPFVYRNGHRGYWCNHIWIIVE